MLDGFRASAQRRREEKTDLLLKKRAGLDLGVKTLPQQGDALLDDVLRRAGAGRDQHRLAAVEPGRIDVGRPVDQVRRPSAVAAISASRRLFELFWLPTTRTTSARCEHVRTTSCRFCVA